MGSRARDIMQRQVLSVSPDDPLLSVQRLFYEEEIGGAPVVDDGGRVLGMVTSIDLLRAASEEHDSARATPAYFRDLLEFSGPDWADAPEDFQDRLNEIRVSEVMTQDAVTVDIDEEVPAIAKAIRENRVHRVLVVEDGQLRGIISTFDLVGLLE